MNHYELAGLIIFDYFCPQTSRNQLTIKNMVISNHSRYLNVALGGRF